MKASFTDPDGREWKLRLTVGAVEEVKRETGVELGDENDSKWLELLFGRRSTLVEVLAVLCEKQMKESSVTPEDFGHLFDGATISAAGDALAAAVADFFPRARISKALRENLEKILAAGEDKAIEDLETRLASLQSAIASPDSPESIPAG